ncbi:MAG TPA: phosphoenolpyruvate carboxylase, partial [Spirochaetia bacterium]|nr:phosphoenolpyruvate carboxylase [Spirochaetia bacterium]
MYKSEKLDIEIRMLGRVLGDVIKEQAGTRLYELEEEIRLTARARRLGDPDAETKLLQRINSMTTDEARTVARAFTIFFDLANLSEDRQRVRSLREREHSNAPKPRSESVAEVVELLKDEGFSAQQVADLLRALSIELVFTAHPTEAKRRSVRVKVRHLREYLAALDRENLLPREQEHILTQIRTYMTGLWQTDLLRARRPTVLEEVDLGLYFTSTLWSVIPSLYRDTRRALERSFPGADHLVPAFLHVGSWIGGDRDGNPHVTAEVSERAFIALRRASVQAHLEQCRRVFDSLSPSVLQVPASEPLRIALDRAIERYPQTLERIEPLSPFEIYRRFLAVIEWKLNRTLAVDSVEEAFDGAYGTQHELLDDLELLARSLIENNGHRILDGDLQDWLWQVETFGLHLAHLDIRQESSWNTRVVAELMRRAAIHDSYERLEEKERLTLLAESMHGAGKAMIDDAQEGLSEEAKETIRLFRLINSVSRRFGSESLGGYVISMTHRVSDVLAVLWLLRRFGQAEHSADIRIIPLFETIDDLGRAPEILEGMLRQPNYRSYLEAQGNIQTVMIGYSDSTKDGGYLSANWSLFKAQSTLYEKGRELGVTTKFFHGRGGSLGRGGGPAARSILSLPPQTVSAGLRMTEQGEVLAERYDDPQIAYRHLEQVVW